MAIECVGRPDLHDFLTGAVLYDNGYPMGDFSWPTDSLADNWRLVGHPLTAKAGQILESRATACIEGQTVFDGFPIGGSDPSYCASSLPQWGLQQEGASALWEDYKQRALAWYAAYTDWMDTSDPSFLDRIECYDNNDLLTVFQMLDQLSDLKGKLTEEEMDLLENVADGSICPAISSAGAAAVSVATRPDWLDAYIHALNALSAAGSTGASLYAWLVAPHLDASRECVLALFDYDQAMTAAGFPLAASSAAAALAAAEAAAPPGGIVGLSEFAIAAKAPAVKRRVRLEKAQAPQSMAPPRLEEGRRKTDQLQEIVDRAAADNEKLALSLTKAGADEYALFLEQCAANQSGPEVSQMLKHWQGGERAWCPPLEAPYQPPEEKRGNLAVVLGVGGLLVGGPVGGLAGGALGAWLDQRGVQ